jgi:hypothetical protein
MQRVTAPPKSIAGGDSQAAFSGGSGPLMALGSVIVNDPSYSAAVAPKVPADTVATVRADVSMHLPASAKPSTGPKPASRSASEWRSLMQGR